MSIEGLLSAAKDAEGRANLLMSQAPNPQLQTAQGAVAHQAALEDAAKRLGDIHASLVATHTAVSAQGFSPASGLLFNEIEKCVGVMIALGKHVALAAALSSALATGVPIGYHKTASGLVVPNGAS